MSDALRRLLDELRALPHETEWLEFKQNWSEPDDVGAYLSALANSAALAGRPCGWLIWGVHNDSHDVVGTSVRPQQLKGKGNEDLEPWLLRHLDPRIDVVFHPPLTVGEHVVVMVEVPAAATKPVTFMHEAWIRIGSHKKKLREFDEKARKLWALAKKDWSADVVDAATVADLDATAVAFARAEYAKKQPQLADEAKGWDTATFLNKTRLAIGGKLTNAALLLLGQPGCVHLLGTEAKITWRLDDAQQVGRDYEHIGLPFILAEQALLKKIRNLRIRYMPGGSLFTEEVNQYDERVLREALHNCIAHQDYSAAARITVLENDDGLTFTNVGSFIPGSIENVFAMNGPPAHYRNRHLVDMMVSLNMIDSIGSGIIRMFQRQRERNFAMPDYDLSNPQRVVVQIAGKILDERYTRLLLKNTSLPLADVIALDKVQKKKPLPPDDLARLKAKRLVEGRGKNVFVSAVVAAATGDEVGYIDNRGVDQQHYRSLVEVYLQQFPGGAARADLEKVLLDKMPARLTAQQRKNRVKNLLQDLRREGRISVVGEGRQARWHVKPIV